MSKPSKEKGMEPLIHKFQAGILGNIHILISTHHYNRQFKELKNLIYMKMKQNFQTSKSMFISFAMPEFI